MSEIDREGPRQVGGAGSLRDTSERSIRWSPYHPGLSLFTAAVAMKAPVFSHTCPPHLLPHSQIRSLRVSQSPEGPGPSACRWLGSHPAVLPEQRDPHRYKPRKQHSINLCPAPILTGASRTLQTKAFAFQEQGKNIPEKTIVSKVQ